MEIFLKLSFISLFPCYFSFNSICRNVCFVSGKNYINENAHTRLGRAELIFTVIFSHSDNLMIPYFFFLSMLRKKKKRRKTLISINLTNIQKIQFCTLFTKFIFVFVEFFPLLLLFFTLKLSFFFAAIFHTETQLLEWNASLSSKTKSTISIPISYFISK